MPVSKNEPSGAAFATLLASFTVQKHGTGIFWVTLVSLLKTDIVTVSICNWTVTISWFRVAIYKFELLQNSRVLKTSSQQTMESIVMFMGSKQTQWGLETNVGYRRLRPWSKLHRHDHTCLQAWRGRLSLQWFLSWRQTSTKVHIHSYGERDTWITEITLN